MFSNFLRPTWEKQTAENFIVSFYGVRKLPVIRQTKSHDNSAAYLATAEEVEM